MNIKDFEMKKIDNKITYQKNKLEIYQIKKKNDKPVKRGDLIKFCEKVKNDIKKKHSNGLISITIQYPDHYYTGSIGKLNDEIHYFTSNDYAGMHEDPEEYESFYINFIPLPKNKGGKDENNDCLINCIKKVIQSQKDKITAENIKKHLNLNRDDMISIDDIPRVENYINSMLRSSKGNEYAINITGDYKYTSSLKTPKGIDLILSNEHYAINEQTINIKKNFSHKERNLIVYDGDLAFDGTNILEFSIEKYRDTLAKPQSVKDIYVSKHWIIKNLKKSYKDMPIEEAYNLYHQMASKLRDSNPYYNLFKNDVKNCALNSFYSKVMALHPDDIKRNEANTLEDATFSAVTYWEPFQGASHSYDINSHYPNTISKNNHYFPIKEGEYLTVDKIESDKFGIYHCMITSDKKTKLFTFNRKNWYTSIDITHALDYGLYVELIQDGQPNFLYYSKEKLINGAFLFKNYVTDLFDLKSSGVEGAKLILNILWGALSEKNTYMYKPHCSERLDLQDCELLSLGFSGSSVDMKAIYYDKPYYLTNFARIKPFVLAYGRLTVYKVFKDYEDAIIRVHTDSMTVREAIPAIPLSDKLGGLKLEVCEMHIEGLNKIKKTKI